MKRVSLWLAVLLSSLSAGSTAEVERYANYCESHLGALAPLSERHEKPTLARVNFGGQVLALISRRDAIILASLRREVRSSTAPEVVIYTFIETPTGIATLRLETDPNHRSRETLVKRTSISAKDFHDHLVAATQPTSIEIRRQLRQELGVTENPNDNGKLVLLFDPSFYGAVPRSFDLDHALVFGSPTVRQAVEHSKALEKTRFIPEDITAFVGYPENEAEYSAVFGSAHASDVTEWSAHMREIRGLAAKHNFTTYGIKEMNSLGSKETLLQKIANSKAIIWIIAHSDGCFVRLSTGEQINITPSDISEIRLIHSPFVMIRVCDAADSGFAEAFLKAGASAVWVNKGISNAARVNQELSSFLDKIPKGSLGNAIRLTEKESETYYRGSTLYVERSVPNDGKKQGE